jgi:acetolactate synthase-1/2/3 large subunit
MYHSDLLIVLGSRLDIRQTGSEVNSFSQQKKIIRIDIDEQELGFSKISAAISVKADVKVFLSELLKQGVERKDTQEWKLQIVKWKEQFSSEQFYGGEKFNTFNILKSVSAKLKDRKVIVTTGVGCHQQFVARYFSFDYPNKIWMTSAGHGTMGFDLPANIGAVMSADKDYVGVVFVGDGSFQMNLQELAMVKEYELPIKIFVFDDNSLNLVAQFQNMNWKCAPSTENKINPSFSAIAQAYGLESFDIYNEEELSLAVEDIFKNNKPALVHCHITSCENVLPMLLGGQKLNEMYPFEGAVKL